MTCPARNASDQLDLSIPDLMFMDYCADLMFVGCFCSKPFGTYSWHSKFNDINNREDKQKIERHVANSPNIWSNSRFVRSLADTVSELKFGDASGPTGE